MYQAYKWKMGCSVITKAINLVGVQLQLLHERLFRLGIIAF